MADPQEEDPRSQVTRLLVDWGSGDEHALEQLTPLVYGELRRIARSHLSRERNAQTLRPTELVHEAYMRLVAQENVNFANRHHFYGVAAHLMRRKKNSQKRGGGVAALSLDEALVIGEGRDAGIVALDDAMNAGSSLFQVG